MRRRRLIHPGKGTSMRMQPHELVRFLKFVDHKSRPGCWLWTGRCDENGYGQFWFRGQARGAHRVSYATFRGPIRNGNDIDHKYHCPHNCVRPECLCQKTRHANSADGAAYQHEEPAPF